MKLLHIASVLLAAGIGESHPVIDLDYQNPDLLAGGINMALGESGERRLLQFDESNTQWATFEELLEFKRQGKTFFDITDHQELAGVKTNEKVSYPSKLAQEKLVRKLAETLDKQNMHDNLEHLTSYHTRYAKSETGFKSSLWLRDQVEAIASNRSDITVTLFDHEWQQKSLIASINGTKNPDHVVVVGAHQDSLNLILPWLRAPGADDDGSGTVTILEVFRNLVDSDFRPENTVEFHWYSAEELGLLGSQDIFDSYSKQGVDVKAMLQQDMTGYNKGTMDADNEDSLGVITDYVDEGLTDFIKLVVDTYCDIGYVETTCGYACSDHASASKFGYPSSFVIESEFDKSNHAIHTFQDTIDKLSFDHMLQHAKLTSGFVVELAHASF